MAGVSFDFSELEEWSAKVEEIPDRALTNVRAAVEVTARHIKDDARDEAKRIGAHAKKYPYSIDYDMRAERDSIGADIGPQARAGNQAALGGLLESGSPTSAPHPHLTPALKANRADFQRGLMRAVLDATED